MNNALQQTIEALAREKGIEADVIITAARTSTSSSGPRQKGISLFLVENGPSGPRFERTRYAAMQALMVNKVHWRISFE